MYVGGFRTKNMKCFRDSDDVEMQPGLNVFAGSNNSGKSALLQSVSLLGNILFESRDDIRFGDLDIQGFRSKSRPDNRLQIVLRVELTEGERKRALTRVGVPLKKTEDDSLSLHIMKEVVFYLHDTWGHAPPGEPQVPGMSVEKITSTGPNGKAFDLAKVAAGRMKRYRYEAVYERLTLVPTPVIRRSGAGFHVMPRGEFPFDILDQIRRSIYYVSPHRVAPPSEGFSLQESLASNAQNLHQVLQTLYNNERPVFEEIEAFICDTFKDIAGLEMRTLGNNTIAVHLAQRGTGLKIPLVHSGSGIEQALAIATVIMTSQEPRVILIDEPHVFLHPRAEKRLILLLERNAQHQYLVATHSPIWLNRLRWFSLHWVSRQGGISNVRPILIDETGALESLFRDLGVENSDWTGADRMIFVEGLSDERLYRILLQRVGCEQLIRNAVFVPIEGSGWVRGSKVEHFFRLCSRILDGVSSLPLQHLFVFDGHEVDCSYLQRLKKRHPDRVRSLQRYEVENFLLEPEAICEAIKEELADYFEERGEKTTLPEPDPTTVTRKLEELKQDGKLRSSSTANPERWDYSIIASSVLEQIYAEFKMSYNKVASGPRIAQRLSKKHLDSIKEELHSLFSGNQGGEMQTQATSSQK